MMKRRVITKRAMSMLLALVLGVGTLCACGKETSEESNAKEATSESVDESADESADETLDNQNTESASVKVGLALSGTLGDESVHDQAYAGLMQVQEDFGCEVKAVECTDPSMYIDTLQTLCEAGYQLVCCDAFGWADALSSVAPNYPDVKFMILDTVVEGDNITSFTYATNECAFLAGVAAAMKSESGVVGFIGGMEIPTIQKYQKGFEEGVAYINPDAKVLAKYIGSDDSAWNDPAKAKSLTLDAISNGADVCFHAAGGSGLGMIEACVEQDIYAIGVNTDQTHLAPDNMLTSALTKGDRAIYLFVESYINGTPMSGATLLDCENDGVGVVESEFFDDTIKTQIESCKEKIISGEIQVTDVLAS